MSEKEDLDKIDIEITYEEFEIPSDYPIKNPDLDFEADESAFKANLESAIKPQRDSKDS
ncbi:MAG: hypothetical protein RLN90_01070 [Balneolaceae bacterium]